MADAADMAPPVLWCRHCDVPLVDSDPVERDAANQPVCADCWEAE